MEIDATIKRVIGIIERVSLVSPVTATMKMKDVIQDSLLLMKVIVSVENEFDIFLDDINFIELYNYDIKGFIDYAKIG
jgi:acyl carrier protein